MAKTDDSLFGSIFGKNGVFDQIFGPYKKPKTEAIAQKIRITLEKEHLARLVQGKSLAYNTPCCGDMLIEIVPAQEETPATDK